MFGCAIEDAASASLSSPGLRCGDVFAVMQDGALAFRIRSVRSTTSLFTEMDMWSLKMQVEMRDQGELCNYLLHNSFVRVLLG